MMSWSEPVKSVVDGFKYLFSWIQTRKYVRYKNEDSVKRIIEERERSGTEK